MFILLLAVGTTGYVITQPSQSSYAQTGATQAAASLSYSAIAVIAATPQLQSFTLAGHPVTVASNLAAPRASSLKSSLGDEPEPAAARMANRDGTSAASSPSERTPLEPPCDRSVSSLYCVYTVQPGDTLSSIAKSFGLESSGDVASWELLVQSNKPDIVSAEDYIQAGQKLRVPLENGVIHVVLTGETLSELALAYGVDVSTITGGDGDTPSVLTIGQEVLIRRPNRIPPPLTAIAAAAPTVTPTQEATTTPDVTTTATPDTTPVPTPTIVAATSTASPSATGTVRPATTTPGRTQVRGTPSPSRAGFIWPATGPISSYLGPSHPLGIDIDLFANPNAPIVAAAAGTVTFAGGNPCCSYGLYVIVDHGNGFSTLYAHLASISVSQGQKVQQGQLLGLGGRTGYATGNHLHFEVRLGDAVIDPLSVLP